MVYKIIWSPRALKSFATNLRYLEDEWSQNEVTNFIVATEAKLEMLTLHPSLGVAKSRNSINVRRTVIHKRILLIYKIKERKKEIELVRFWNTYQNPSKLNNK